MSVMLDNRGNYNRASQYRPWPAMDAWRIVKKQEFHYTPQHANWLNMAEIAFSVASGSCHSQRPPDEETLISGVSASKVLTLTYRSCLPDKFLDRHP